MAADCNAHMFAGGLESKAVTAYEDRLRVFAEKEIIPRGQKAETEEEYPREVIQQLGASGILRERWSPMPNGDPGRGVLIAEMLGGAGFGGVAAGATVHAEAVIAMLARFGKTAFLRELLEKCLTGSAVTCIAVSESTGGSDLSRIQTSLTPAGRGRWHLQGAKKYVSHATGADFALVLARVGSDGGSTPKLAMIAVPRQDMRIQRPLTRIGLHSLPMAPVEFDTDVSAEAILGIPGFGMLVVTHGLTHERLAISGVTVGSAFLAINLATTHLRRRSQFGVKLMEHQALRVRLAELAASADTLRAAVRGAAHTGAENGQLDPRSIAGLKVTAARLGERIISECMHFFGGAGYLEEETPLARMWRDCRAARIAGGTDEMMWEIVADHLAGDSAAYDRLVALS
jgi:acyl-ACP dehydrogenase